jgi:hypothetical protein
MLTLGNLFILMLIATAAAWLWHGHGLRELALQQVKRHCAKLEVELLDGNVALRRYALIRDGRGQRRFARIYDFEFTVTGEQRLTGSITLFGKHPGRIDLDPHPFQTPAADDAKVVQLDDWRRSHARPPLDPPQHHEGP